MENLAQYDGKKVIVVKNLDAPNEDGHSAIEIEGTVLSTNQAIGIVIKPKGKTMSELIKTGEIEDVRLVPVTIKAIKAKEIKAVTLDNVRQHLVDRHGFALTLINSADDERALKMHAEIDHSDLGHTHADA